MTTRLSRIFSGISSTAGISSLISTRLGKSTISLSTLYIYSTKKLGKMCSIADCNESSKKLEIHTLVCYKVCFFIFLNETSLELAASAVAGKNNVKVD